jgi:hypothetical protein
MAEVRFVEATLFGDREAYATSEGEFFLARSILGDWDDARERADWCMERVPHTGDLLLDIEDHLLLRECMDAYIHGLFASCIASADAFIERIVTDRLETLGKAKEASGSLGRKLATLEATRILDDYSISRISHLHRVRNNFVHERGPDDEMRLFRRELKQHRLWIDILKADAQEAICLAYGLAVRLKRNFPRLGLPGSFIE